MKNTIKPAQYDPYNLISSSGNILINSGIDFFNLDVSRSLQGDFNFVNSVKINGMDSIYPNSTNSVLNFSNGNRIFAGSNNVVNGSNCYVYGGLNCSSTGTNNVILYGNNTSVTNSSNTIALGNSIIITHNNATVFGDTSNNAKGSNGINTLTLNYISGTFVEHNFFIKKTLNIQNNLSVTGNITGANIISNNNISATNNLNITSNGFIGNNLNVTGNISVGGNISITGNSILNNATISGSRIQTQNDINNYSGYVNTLISQYVATTGNQTITGIKTFKSIPSFEKGISLPTTDSTRFVPSTSTSNGTIGQVAFSGNYLYVCTGANLWGRIQISNW